MVDLSVIRDLIACFGVLAGFSYYVLTVRATRKNQQMQLEARRAQLYSQIYSWFIETDAMVEYMEMLNWEWSDYSDFERKYGSDNNVQEYAKRSRVWASLEMIGMMVKDGVVDVESIFPLRTFAMFQWFKFKDVIKEQRKRYYTPTFNANWEYLVNEFIKYGEKIGDPWTPPTSLSKYIPED